VGVSGVEWKKEKEKEKEDNLVRKRHTTTHPFNQ
jgi:hypothetical protein